MRSPLMGALVAVNTCIVTSTTIAMPLEPGISLSVTGQRAAIAAALPTIRRLFWCKQQVCWHDRKS